MDILEESLKSPSKELNIQTIERCKGFTIYLTVSLNYDILMIVLSICIILQNLLNQLKSQLIASTRNLYYLRYYYKCFNEICLENDFIGKTLYLKIKGVLKTANIVMNQYKTFLQSAPNSPQFGDELTDVPILTKANSNFIKYKNDDQWNVASASINNITSSIQKICHHLDKSKFQLPSTEYDLTDAFDHIPVNNLYLIVKELEIISENIERIKSILGVIPLTECLLWLAEEIVTITEELQLYDTTDQISDTVKIQRNVTKLANSILISIQTIYKKYQSNSVESVNEEDDDINLEMKDDHLKSHIFDNLQDDLVKVDVRDVLKYAKNLSKCTNINKQKLHLSACVPLLEQICLLYEYFVTQQVSAYRTIGKLNSILLNLFIDLAKKVTLNP